MGTQSATKDRQHGARRGGDQGVGRPGRVAGDSVPRPPVGRRYDLGVRP
jgi:hypothetical protein